MSAPNRKQMPIFCRLIAPGLAAIILFAPERVLIHLEQPTIGAEALQPLLSRADPSQCALVLSGFARPAL